MKLEDQFFQAVRSQKVDLVKDSLERHPELANAEIARRCHLTP